MSELEDIKARAVEREVSPYWRANHTPEEGELKADLDCVIAIADDLLEKPRGLLFKRMQELEKERDEAIAKLKNLLEVVDFAAMERTADKMHQFAEERDEARAAALMLRDIFDSEGNAFASNVTEVLAVTEWLEAYR